MARNYNGDAVLAIRSADRTLSAWGADRARHIIVRARFAIRNLQELLPHGPLKGAARIEKGNGELPKRSREIAGQFFLQLINVIMVARYDRAGELFAERREL